MGIKLYMCVVYASLFTHVEFATNNVFIYFWILTYWHNLLKKHTYMNLILFVLCFVIVIIYIYIYIYFFFWILTYWHNLLKKHTYMNLILFVLCFVIVIIYIYIYVHRLYKTTYMNSLNMYQRKITIPSEIKYKRTQKLVHQIFMYNFKNKSCQL